MRSYLNCDINTPDVELLKWIKQLGFVGNRQAFRMQQEWAHVRMVFRTLKEADVSPLFLLPLEEDTYDIDDVLQYTETISAMIEDYGFDRSDVALEFGNEPDIFSTLWKQEPELLGETFCKAFPLIRKWCPNITILTPSVSGIDRSRLRYASRLFAPIKKSSGDYEIAFHRYPAGTHHGPWPGAADRETELANFLAVTRDAENRPFWVTETGYSQAYWKKRPFPLCFIEEPFKIDQASQLQFAAWEYAWWSSSKARALSWYQINDGPDPNDTEDNYGIREVDGTPKLIASGFPAIHEAVRQIENGEDPT